MPGVHSYEGKVLSMKYAKPRTHENVVHVCHIGGMNHVQQPSGSHGFKSQQVGGCWKILTNCSIHWSISWIFCIFSGQRQLQSCISIRHLQMHPCGVVSTNMTLSKLTKYMQKNSPYQRPITQLNIMKALPSFVN